jgi:carbamoyltransferase
MKDKSLILGINYSGYHDSAVVLMDSHGEIRFASSLERVTRIKQDGCPPSKLLEGLDWNSIAAVAVSTDEVLHEESIRKSRVHPLPLTIPRADVLRHAQPFYDFLAQLPAPLHFVCHQRAHAASAFWPSGFEDSLCLCYDGGIPNSYWFGGVFRADRAQGLAVLDYFDARRYAKITSLYSVITGVLGFTPNKHEGKVTGLAAYGRVSSACRQALESLLLNDYLLMESCVEWLDSYLGDHTPFLHKHPDRLHKIEHLFLSFSREDLAANVQMLAEDHILSILANIKAQGWTTPRICLSGGLFANVKINQRVQEAGYQVFVAPPMTDDGTALGAAYEVAAKGIGFAPRATRHVFWGHCFNELEINHAINCFQLVYSKIDDPAQVIAQALANGQVVGVFQGAMEFGPRALGHRSLLAAATDDKINQTLNQRLSRTEFMPFAPMTRVEDIEYCYPNLTDGMRAAEFMTVTTACSPDMLAESPAVVHVDGTARPQIIAQAVHPLIHGILSKYYALTGVRSIVNTSFNIHEEPIVCTPDHAIAGFLESGIDALYFEGGFWMTQDTNLVASLEYLRTKRKSKSQKQKMLERIEVIYSQRLDELADGLVSKEQQIQMLAIAAKERLDLIHQLDADLKSVLKKTSYLENHFWSRLGRIFGVIQPVESKKRAHG